MGKGQWRGDRGRGRDSREAIGVVERPLERRRYSVGMAWEEVGIVAFLPD